MIQAYSKRLLFPFLGQVQIVEFDRLRALTLDGDNWEVQLKVTFDDAASASQRKHSYIRVAVIRPSRIDRNPVPPHLDIQLINTEIEKLATILEDITVPLTPADLYEYWLLDGVDDGGVGRRAADALGLQLLDQAGLGEPGRRRRLVGHRHDLGGIQLLAHLERRQQDDQAEGPDAADADRLEGQVTGSVQSARRGGDKVGHEGTGLAIILLDVVIPRTGDEEVAVGADLEIGGSVAVNGACLTAVEISSR